MNTRSVNSAAGVITAALQQNRVPAGIALALDSAGLLMTPETAAELVRLRAERKQVIAEVERFGFYGGAVPVTKALVKRADELVNENAALRDQVVEYERQLESARVDGQRLIRAEQRAAELEAVLDTHRRDDRAEIDRLRNRVAELEARLAADGITRRIAPTQALQPVMFEDPCRPCGCPKRFNRHAEGCPTLPEGEFYGTLHHSYRVGHDLPEMGGGS